MAWKVWAGNVTDIQTLAPAWTNDGNQTVLQNVAARSLSSLLHTRRQGLNRKEEMWKLLMYGTIRSTLGFQMALESTAVDTVFSPVGLLVPLSTIALGSSGESLNELLNAIGFKDTTKIKAYMTNLVGHMTEEIDHVDMMVVNKILVGSQYRLHPNFELVVTPLDFTNSSSVYRFNKLTASHTKGKVSTLLWPSDIEADTSLFVASIVHFKALFAETVRSAGKKPFETETGPIHHPMLYGRVTAYYNNYVPKMDAELLQIPFGEEGVLSLIILLPKSGGLGEVVRQLKLDPDPLGESLLAAKPNRVNLTLPKFSVHSTLYLKDDLKTMELIRVFASKFSDIDHIADEKLHITNIKQVAFLEIIEGGISEQTLNSADLEILAEEPLQTIKFEVTRPFYFIVNYYSEQLLAGFYVGKPMHFADPGMPGIMPPDEPGSGPPPGTLPIEEPPTDLHPPRPPPGAAGGYPPGAFPPSGLPGANKPLGSPGSRELEGRLPGSNRFSNFPPESNQPSRYPESNPYSRYPDSNPPSRYPGSNQPSRYPGSNQPSRYPGSNQPSLYPESNPPSRYPGNNQPSHYPENNKPSRHPGNNPPSRYAPGSNSPWIYPSGSRPHNTNHPPGNRPLGSNPSRIPPWVHPHGSQPLSNTYPPKRRPGPSPPPYYPPDNKAAWNYPPGPSYKYKYSDYPQGPLRQGSQGGLADYSQYGPPELSPGDMRNLSQGGQPDYAPGGPPDYPPGGPPDYPPGGPPDYPPGGPPEYPPGGPPDYPPGGPPDYSPGGPPDYSPGGPPEYPPGFPPEYPQGDLSEPTHSGQSKPSQGGQPKPTQGSQPKPSQDPPKPLRQGEPPESTPGGPLKAKSYPKPGPHALTPKSRLSGTTSTPDPAGPYWGQVTGGPTKENEHDARINKLVKRMRIEQELKL